MVCVSRIIGIVSGKGGVGKTTVAINLSAALSHYMKKYVTLVDCNLTTSHLGIYLGLYQYEKSLNHAMRGEAHISDTTYHHSSGIRVVPAALSLKELEGTDVSQLRSAIESLAATNDLVLLDSGPGLGREALATLRACDQVLFVATPDVPSVIDVARSNEIAEELGVAPLGIVLNMIHKKDFELSAKEVEELTHLPVIASFRFDKTMRKCLAQRTPLVTHDPSAPMSRQFHRLASRLMNEPYEEQYAWSSLQKLKFW